MNKAEEYLEFIRLKNNLSQLTGMIIESLNRTPKRPRKPLDPLQDFYLLTLKENNND